VRAALESSAFQTIELAHAMMEDVQGLVPIKALKVDGGLSKNDLTMQFQSDLLSIPLIRPSISETSALGAAYIAGLGVGLWSSLEDIERLWHKEKEWTPKMPAQQRAKYVSNRFIELTN
jgi:glycerol kinase